MGDADLAPSVVLVDDVSACRAAVERLLGESEVAVDLEGVELGRDPGRICVIQVSTGDLDTFIFDITVLQQDAFDDGRLKVLFEDPQVVKVLYDVRSDCDALLHNHNVRMVNAYDLQVLYQTVFAPRSQHLHGLRRAFGIYAKTAMSPDELRRLEDIKDAGVRLFAPEKGGSYAVWDQRPLPEALVTYCAADVRHLLRMKALWGGPELDGFISDIAQSRIDDFVSKEVIVQAAKTKLDFEIPQSTVARMPEGLEMAEIVIRKGKVGRVIGRGGSQLQAIEAASGAAVSIRDDSVAVVLGTPPEVARATQLVEEAMSG